MAYEKQLQTLESDDHLTLKKISTSSCCLIIVCSKSRQHGRKKIEFSYKYKYSTKIRVAFN